jgi:hypothetical protein
MRRRMLGIGDTSRDWRPDDVVVSISRREPSPAGDTSPVTEPSVSVSIFGDDLVLLCFVFMSLLLLLLLLSISQSVNQSINKRFIDTNPILYLQVMPL